MTTIIFVDFNKAFDSIDRRAISIVLSKYGVSELLIANVMQFCIGTSAVVATAHGNTVSLYQIGALVYADNIAITCDTIDQAKNVFQSLEMNASKVGLKINFKKRKILHAGHNSQPSPVTTIDGYTLKI